MTKGDNRRFLLLYGSQTGQAKAIAEEIYEHAPNHGLQPEMHCLSVTDKKFSVEKETCVVIVVSTTGDGEPPDTASKFWRRIKKKTLSSDYLANLNYALLGLGDSNYNNFCRNPRNFDTRFEELGAKRFHPSGYADDAVGLELVVEPWMDGLWPVLRKQLGIDDSQWTGATNHVDTVDGRPIEDTTKNISGEVIEPSNGKDVPGGPDKQSQPDERTSGTKNKIDDAAAIANTDLVNTARTDQPTALSDPNKDIIKTEINQTSIDNKTAQSVEGTLQPNDSVLDVRTNLETDKGPSLTHSVPPLSESGLTMPLLPSPYLQVMFQDDVEMNINPLSPQGNAKYPSSNSAVAIATVVSATKLTSDDAVKTALDVEFDITDTSIDYQAGDAFSIICPNPAVEVDQLIQRLGLSEQADTAFSVELMTETKKRRATVPDYIPQPCTVRHVLTHCCDIRTHLKKAFIRMLVEHTGNDGEKRRLQELCSKQGVNDYGAYIRDACISIVDLLLAFPSCNPPLERLLEHLPRLQPRPYSISSSPLVDPERLHFVFNIVEFPQEHGRTTSRQGVCTGWLNSITKAIQCETGVESSTDIAQDMAALSIDQRRKVPIFSRTNTYFRLPDEPSTPIIMIGPGTGVAPFVGFLEHRQLQVKRAESSGDVAPLKFGTSWLFFGCRHKDRDYLYRDKLQHFTDNGVLTNLAVSFSRDAVPVEESNPASQKPPRYVQDNLKLHATEILDLILDSNAVLYVCGDAKNMAKHVNETLLQLISQRTGQGAYESTLILAKLREEKRYREDIWT